MNKAAAFDGLCRFKGVYPHDIESNKAHNNELFGKALERQFGMSIEQLGSLVKFPTYLSTLDRAKGVVYEHFASKLVPSPQTLQKEVS